MCKLADLARVGRLVSQAQLGQAAEASQVGMVPHACELQVDKSWKGSKRIGVEELQVVQGELGEA